MSRRQSRASLETRQNDTLLEFENFKKKFLLANKHITKLNSTLSVRIEELNAQIQTLNVENLRLRASEIALAAQLKREQERSRNIIADAEAATHSLIKHLGHIRKSFNVPHRRSSSSDEPPPLPMPRAKRPVPNPDASPAPNRLARAPTVPGIVEDDETNVSSPEDIGDVEEVERNPSPIRRRKTKPRLSESRLPLLTRVPTPPLPTEVAATPDMDLDPPLIKAANRKPTRRQSGLLTSVSITTVSSNGISTELVPPRPPSPAFGSPLRREAGLAEGEDEVIVVNGEEEQEVEVIFQAVTKREKKERKREREKDKEKDSGDSGDRPKERKRIKDTEDAPVVEGSKFKLKDVTNSRVSHSVLSTAERDSDIERQHTPDDDTPAASHSSTVRHALAATPAPRSQSALSYLPTPRSSSPLPPPAPSEPEQTGGRERRVRKSINYAEPKLNTKMRKPDLPPPVAKRSSSDGLGSRASLEGADDGAALPAPTAGIKRKKSRAYVPLEDDEESEGAQADAEFGGLRGGSGWVNLDGRRRSVQPGSSLRRIEGDDSRRHSMAV